MSTAHWGTGYGSKRHLVEQNSIVTTKGRDRGVAVCSALIYCDKFEYQQPNRGAVMSKAPCARCEKKSGLYS